MRAGHFAFLAVTWLNLEMVCIGSTTSLIPTAVPINYKNGIVPITLKTFPIESYSSKVAFQREGSDLDFVLPLVLTMLISKQHHNCGRCSDLIQNIPVPFPIPIPINSPIITPIENIPYESHGPMVSGDEIPWDEIPVILRKGDIVVSYDSGVMKTTSPDGEVKYDPIPYTGIGPAKKHVYVCNCDEGAPDEPEAEVL